MQRKNPAGGSGGAMPGAMRGAAACIIPAMLLLLAGCATQAPDAVSEAAGSPGFLHGLFHGFIFPFAWIGSLFSPSLAVYAVPNNGGWYDFGFFLGITVLGGGSWFSSRRR